MWTPELVKSAVVFAGNELEFALHLGPRQQFSPQSNVEWPCHIWHSYYDAHLAGLHMRNMQWEMWWFVSWRAAAPQWSKTETSALNKAVPSVTVSLLITWELSLGPSVGFHAPFWMKPILIVRWTRRCSVNALKLVWTSNGRLRFSCVCLVSRRVSGLAQSCWTVNAQSKEAENWRQNRRRQRKVWHIFSPFCCSDLV